MMLTLPIKKKWFDMIVAGEKKEEYREIKPYYDSRFKKLDYEYDPEDNCMAQEYKIESHRRIILEMVIVKITHLFYVIAIYS